MGIRTSPGGSGSKVKLAIAGPEPQLGLVLSSTFSLPVKRNLKLELQHYHLTLPSFVVSISATLGASPNK